MCVPVHAQHWSATQEVLSVIAASPHTQTITRLYKLTYQRGGNPARRETCEWMNGWMHERMFKSVKWRERFNRKKAVWALFRFTVRYHFTYRRVLWRFYIRKKAFWYFRYRISRHFFWDIKICFSPDVAVLSLWPFPKSRSLLLCAHVCVWF